MKIKPETSIFLLLLLFVLGWGTQTLTLFDVGRYSFPLIIFVGLPFCIRMTYRGLSCLILVIGSSVFTVAVALLRGAQMSHVLSQTVLQAMAISFAAGIAAINWHKHLPSLERAVVMLGVPIAAYGAYQMLARIAHLPGAFLPVTNKQYYIEGGLQREWDKIEATRASSVFSEPSELGFYCLWLFVIALSTENKTLRILALLSAATGILVSQSLSAALGAVAIFIGFCIITGVSRRLARSIFLTVLVFGLAVLAIRPFAPEPFDRFSDRIKQAAAFDERADSGRIDHLPACMALIKASPIWGYGISTLAAADSTGSDVTTVNYVMVWMERGTLGALLFFIPWFALPIRTLFLPRNAHGRTFAFLVMVMTLYSFCNFSITYFLPFWLAFGVSASLVLQTHAVASRSFSTRLSSPYNSSSQTDVAVAS